MTAFVEMRDHDPDAVADAFAQSYGACRLIRPVQGSAEVRAVAGTGFADVAYTVGEHVVVVNVAIDNLGKGMAATAVQNCNLLFGEDEAAGLLRPGTGL